MTGAGREVAVAAVDLGAESGRVMLARVGAERLELTEAHRFHNGPVRVLDTLHWDILSLFRGVLAGLRAAGIGDVPVVVGGIIPPADAEALIKTGVARVYTPKDFDLTQIMRDVVAVVDGAWKEAA
jgi:methylmalonyl-CoA mutase cobalamin-binding domain/chain